MSHPVRVKLCGMTRPTDAVHAVSAGADYVGVILSEGFGRSISPEVAAAISGSIAKPTVGVFVDESPEVVVAKCRSAGVQIIQLHGSEPPPDIEYIRGAGSWTVWKSFSVRDPEEATQRVHRYVNAVEGILFDAWHPEVPGGTGTNFHWAEFRTGRDALPAEVDFVLAGGLNASNVQEAIQALGPDIVDVSSGVEISTGVKDTMMVEEFIRRVRSAGVEPGAGGRGR